MTADPTSGIVVKRKLQYEGRIRRATIRVDRHYEFGIKAGESTTVALQPGAHEVQIWLDWASSPPLTIEVVENQFVHLLTQFPAGSFLRWIFRPAGSISLEVLQE